MHCSYMFGSILLRMSRKVHDDVVFYIPFSVNSVELCALIFTDERAVLFNEVMIIDRIFATIVRI